MCNWKYKLCVCCLCSLYCLYLVDALRPDENSCTFADDVIKCIFFDKTYRVLVKISLKVVCNIPINNSTAFMQKIVRRRSGDKPLSEPMLIKLADANNRHSTSMSQSAVLWSPTKKYLAGYDISIPLPIDIFVWYPCTPEMIKFIIKVIYFSNVTTAELSWRMHQCGIIAPVQNR